MSDGSFYYDDEYDDEDYYERRFSSSRADSARVLTPLHHSEGFTADVPLEAPRAPLFARAAPPLASPCRADLPSAEALSATYLPAAVPGALCWPDPEERTVDRVAWRRRYAALTGLATAAAVVLGARVAYAVYDDPSVIDGVYDRQQSVMANALALLRWAWRGRKRASSVSAGSDADAAAAADAVARAGALVADEESTGGLLGLLRNAATVSVAVVTRSYDAVHWGITDALPGVSARARDVAAATASAASVAASAALTAYSDAMATAAVVAARAAEEAQAAADDAAHAAAAVNANAASASGAHGNNGALSAHAQSHSLASPSSSSSGGTGLSASSSAALGEAVGGTGSAGSGRGRPR